MWQIPITDRTSLDVQNKTSKGYLNASDLNRIESNMQEIANLLKLTITTKTNWTRENFFTAADNDRLKANMEVLKSAYYTYSTSPSVPETPLTTWWKINNIEKLQLDIYTLKTENDKAVYYAGELYSGEDIGVI